MSIPGFKKDRQKGQSGPNLMGKCTFLMMEIKRANPKVHARLNDEFMALQPADSEEFSQRLLQELKQIQDNGGKDMGAIASQKFIPPSDLKPITKNPQEEERPKTPAKKVAKVKTPSSSKEEKKPTVATKKVGTQMAKKKAPTKSTKSTSKTTKGASASKKATPAKKVVKKAGKKVSKKK